LVEARLNNLKSQKSKNKDKNQKSEARPLIFEAWPQLKEKSKMIISNPGIRSNIIFEI